MNSALIFYTGATGGISHAFVFGGITTIPAFVGDTLLHYLIDLSLYFMTACVATVLLGFKDIMAKNRTSTRSSVSIMSYSIGGTLI
ncbi:hypothetical protein [Brochothrix campestris]|uniref:Uncharacterized protein n=1 Tax=Brochothrix campestris FSL F6-1037 TaxID=1265861 RepID=W7D243_9LIST|nr:hypothetical protein [Brochothrix campestris]EUJ39348.1 hypothetical protein BCAMP_07395 [Brochothrix campestris FSL F6-1037]